MSASTQILVRARLLQRVEQLREPTPRRPVVVVAAPPGFGKSTLIRSWLLDLDGRIPVAFTHLRGVGDDRRVLWQRLLTALATALDGPTAAAVRGLPVPDRIGHADFTTELLDVLAGVPLVLIVDDVHEATGGHVTADLDRLVSKAPGSLRLVLLSRTRPQLPSLLDRRVWGEVDVLTAHDLAFTAEETAECCQYLTPSQRDQVWTRTEGWPAMVQLMGFTLDQRGSLETSWIADEGLADRLFGEAFAAAEPAVQQVLLMCAVADPTPLDLLVTLSGRTDAGQVLSSLRGWSGLIRDVEWAGAPAYRLHPLLQAHLFGELLRRDTTAAQQMQTQCADWFLAAHDGLRAVHHAVSSRSLGTLERTVATCGLRLVADGRAAPLVQLLDATSHRTEVGPWTAAIVAAALVDQGRTPRAAALHAARPSAVDDVHLAATQQAVAALLRRRQGTPQGEHPPSPDGVAPDIEMAWNLHHGSELLRAGNLAGSAPLLQRAVDLAAGRSRHALLIDALTFQSVHAAAAGLFPRLRDRLTRALHMAEEEGWTGSPRTALLHMMAGWVAYLDLEDVKARTLSKRALELLDPDEDPTTVLAVHSLAAGVAEGAERLDTRWVHEGWQEDSVRLAPDLVGGMAIADGQVSLHRGRTDRLRETLDGLVGRLGDTAETHTVAAQLAIARGRFDQAERALAPVLEGTARTVWGLTPLSAQIVASQIALAQGHDFQATARLRAALALADEQQTTRPLLALGEPGLTKLTQGRGSWGEQEHLVGRVLTYAATLRDPAPALLTSRELEVMRELPTLRTTEEIAADMLISTNTIKTHLRSIYRKLGVSTRREAVSEARRAGLL